MKTILLLLLFCANALFAGARFGPNQAFDPRQVSNLVFWVSSSSLSGTDGSKVSMWPDRSTAGNSLVSGSSTNQPFLTNNIVNGRPIVQFSASSSYMSNTWAAFSGYATINSFAVLRITTTAAADTQTLPFIWMIGDSVVPPFWVEASSAGALTGEYICPVLIVTALSALSARAGSSTYRATAGTLAMHFYNQSASGSKFFKNGTEYPLDLVSGTGFTTNSASGPLAAVGSGPVFFNATVASGVVTPQAFANTVLDFATYNALLTTNDRKRVEQFFARRYGPTLLQ